MHDSSLPSDRPGDNRRSLDFLFEDFAREEFELASETEATEEWEYVDEGRMARVRGSLRWLGVRLGWLGLAALLGLGSAGIVAATGRSPADDGRPELTYASDKELSAQLDAGVRDLARLNDDVVYLGELARDVLADLSQLNKARLNSDYQDGDATVAKIDKAAAELKTRLSCEPWPSTRDADLALFYGRGLIDRWHSVCLAIDLVEPLADDWSALVSGAKVVIQGTDDISGHDDNAAVALQLATEGRYQEALSQLDKATAFLDDADRIAATMAKLTDVSTLKEWLTRTRTMDEALDLLWRTMIESKGKVTPQVTAALKNVNDAKALLPDDASILQVVVFELEANLPTHGISIEAAKGQLGSALASLTGVNPDS